MFIVLVFYFTFKDRPVVPDTYAASDNTQTEDAYGVVDTTKKKKQKIYGNNFH